MKLSLTWLRSYVSLDGLTPEEIGHRLTMATAEVEGVEPLHRSVEGIVAASIMAVEPIESPDGNSLSWVTLSTGKDTWHTVCGAPNVAVGLTSAFAAPGTVLAGNVTVREQSVHGRTSAGMLLSARELGWGDSHVGIMAFPSGIAAGTPIADLVPAEDHIIDIDNKTITHRPDLWGHYGFARELAAVFNRELKPLDLADATRWGKLPAFPLSIEDTANCPGYCCLDIDGITPDYSPLAIQYLLLAVGLRPINLLVDLTNFIMCELGQPMHAFDGERVRDVIVRRFGTTGPFRTLDSIDRPLIPDDLMIYDHTGPIALAGIMGGEESEIKENTSHILLESANFDPARIRRTALRLNMRSDASMRFEKGQPPYHMGVSLRRFVSLLESAGQKPQVRSSLTCAGDSGDSIRTMSVQQSMLQNAIGMTIPEATVTGILESLGFGCRREGNQLTLTIPPFRSKRDISIPNDIVEEVARVFGYDNITPVMPPTELRRYTFNASLRRQHRVRRFLSTARGCNEVHTYSWYDDAWLRKLDYAPDETLVIKNPAAENTTRMRRELIPNLLQLIEQNAVHQDRFCLYEVGTVHHPEGDGRRQELRTAAVAYQTEKTGTIQNLFLDVKGTLEDLLSCLCDGAVSFAPLEPSGGKPWETAGAVLDIRMNGISIGHLGYVTGKTLPVFERGSQLVWFECSLDSFDSSLYPTTQFHELPVFPGSWMDFSILADINAGYESIAAIVERYSHPIITGRSFLYRYTGKGLPEGKASYTFRFQLGLPDRTLTGEDLTAFHTAVLAFITHEGLALR